MIRATTTLTAFRTADSSDAARPAAAAQRGRHLREIPPQLSLAIHQDLNEIEAEWRRFERTADCTAFQTFDWLSTWQKHVGALHGVRPAIVAGRTGDGELAFLLPLSVVPERFADKLCWLGQDSCDYNAPLLAPDFPERIGAERFLAVWRDVLADIQRSAELHFDWIEFAKMPQTIGAQANPFCHLPVTVNASGVHLTHLGDDWETFYVAKRSSATRRRDRAKRRHMTEFGEIRFITAADADDARRTLELLIEQKPTHWRGAALPTFSLRPATGNFFSISPPTRRPGTSCISVASRLGPTAQRQISASCSAIAITTCWQVSAKRRCRITVQARCICAN